MKDKIKIFLDSDILEKYLLGATTDLEAMQVERYIAMYPEVRDTYNELQDNLEIFAKLHAIEAPQGLKNKIQSRLKAERSGRKKFFRYAIAASITAIMFAGISTFFWNQNQSLQQENSVVSNKIKLLEENMKEQMYVTSLSY